MENFLPNQTQYFYFLLFAESFTLGLPGRIAPIERRLCRTIALEFKFLAPARGLLLLELLDTVTGTTPPPRVLTGIPD